jgi:hypothetical protein
MQRLIARGLLLGALLTAWLFGVTGGCSKDCEQQKTIQSRNPVTGDVTEEPAITCNVILICERKMREPQRVPLRPFNVVDKGYDHLNKGACKKQIEETIPPDCNKAEITFERVCLDAGSSGPGGPGPSGGTIVTVGAASSGDHPIGDNEDRVGGSTADLDEGGQGEL